MSVNKLWDQANVQEALNTIMKRENLTIITAAKRPEFKSGKFPWYKKIFGVHKIPFRSGLLREYPAKWTYVTIRYEIIDDTGYVTSIDYRLAV